MRPCSVYANPTCPASDAGDVLALLRGHRVGLRLVMILLSQQRWTPTAIAELLGCDAATVRRWIHRYSTHGPRGLADQPRRGRLRLGSPRLGARIRRLLDHPRAWTIGRLWLALGQPAISLRTLRGGSARLRRGADPRLVAPGDPDRDQTLAALRQAISDLPQGTVVLAQDETHINLLPWVRATWIARGRRTQVITAGKEPPAHRLRRRAAGHRPLVLPDLPQGRQRHLHRLLRAAPGHLAHRAAGGRGLRQHHHPPLQDRAALAGCPPPHPGTAPATAPRTTLSSASGVRSRPGWPTLPP